MNEIQIISQDVDVFESQERALIDSQVATAKRYPRNLLRVRDNSVAIACMNKETAEACRYAKPTGGKNITGPSVHLARIVVQQFGNVRVQQYVKQITETTVICEAIAMDVETNYAVKSEVRRSIIDRNGLRYKDSVIETNAMAAMAIAERNVILKIIPKSIVDTVYSEAFKFANGDLSDATKLILARDKAFDYFKSEYGATEKEVYECLGLKTKEAVKAEHIADLRGFMQALKDKEITVEELFKRNVDRGSEKPIVQQPDPTEQAAASATETAPKSKLKLEDL